MDLCYLLCLSGLLAVFCGKNLNAGQYVQTFLQNVYIPAVLIGTVNFHHFMLQPSISDLDFGNTKQKLLSGTIFN